MRLEFDYNDANKNVIRFRCVNNSDYPLYAEALKVDPVTDQATTLFSGTLGAHSTFEQSVSRFKLSMDEDGRLVLGNYQIRARWPAG